MPIQPTFINIGPGRCGTSWLHEVLAAHPQIGMGKIKETEFFNTNFSKGIDWYEEHFASLQGKIAIGEVSNNYYLDASVAAKIQDYKPDMKIIINIRDPFSLLVSFYEFGQRRGLNLPPLPHALNEPVGRIMGSGYDYRDKRNALTVADCVSLINAVRLHELTQPFLSAFPRDQIYFFVYEKFRVNPHDVLQEIYNFLQVDPDFLPRTGTDIVNQSITPKSRMLAVLGSKLAFFLRRIGAYRALSSLHRSRVVKRVFFRPTHLHGRPLKEFDVPLGQELVEELNTERKRIERMVPEFAAYLEYS